MRKKIIVILLILSIVSLIESVPSEVNKYHKLGDYWTENNEKYITEENREILNKLKQKIDNGGYLSGDEREKLKDMKEELIKNKLGEEKLKEYYKLIERREEEKELTPEEKKSLFNLEKEMRS